MERVRNEEVFVTVGEKRQKLKVIGTKKRNLASTLDEKRTHGHYGRNRERMEKKTTKKEPDYK